MFTEPYGLQSDGAHSGWIEVVCGSMFSGKTEELMRRLRRAEIAGQKVELFKPSVDQRYHSHNVVSHDKNSLQAHPVDFAGDISLLAGSCQVVGIDEAQFFDPEIVPIVNQLANQGKRVIIAGLDMDYKGRPFGPMPQLLAIAEFVTKLHAICHESGQLANYTYRLGDSEDQVALGSGEAYEARSRKHFWPHQKDEK